MSFEQCVRRAVYTTPLVAALLLAPASPAAQDVTEPALKAAYLYNFAKFTYWPGDVQADPFVMCVLGDRAVGDALERYVRSRQIANHRIVVAQSAGTAPEGRCHVLYVSGIPPRQTAALVQGIRDEPVLSISDVDGFTEQGGIALFFFDNGQLRFNVQPDAVKRARLQIDARLLALSRRR